MGWLGGHTAEPLAKYMTLLKRELFRSARGPVMNDEDWWRLAFDTENKRLYVEHEWAHLDVRSRGAANSGTEQIEIAAYLAGPGVGPGQRELERLIETLFQDQANGTR